MKNKSTFEDIAKLANVSKSAVSKAFSNASDISDETRLAVYLAAEKIGYVSNKKKKLKRLGFLVQNTDYQNENDFGLALLNSFRRVAILYDYDVVLLNFDSNKETAFSYDSFIEKHDLAGAFFVGLDNEHIYAKQIAETSVPTVTFDNFIITDNVSGVGADSIEGIIMAVKHLIDLGHRRIAFLNGNRCSEVSHERLKGYILGHVLNNIDYDASLVRFTDYIFDIAVEDVQFVVDSKATAVVCACDRLAIGLVHRLKMFNLRVPKDISVTGYDNIQFSQFITPELTTIDQNRKDLGETAFFALKNLLEGKRGAKILLPPKLIIRNSTAKI